MTGGFVLQAKWKDHVTPVIFLLASRQSDSVYAGLSPPHHVSLADNLTLRSHMSARVPKTSAQTVILCRSPPPGAGTY